MEWSKSRHGQLTLQRLMPVHGKGQQEVVVEMKEWRAAVPGGAWV